MASDEVVQLYLTHAGVDGAPLRSLAGFQRVHVEVGATQHVQITVPNRNLSIVDPGGSRKIVPGEVQVWVGGTQPLIRQAHMSANGVSGRIKIEGEATLPK